MSASPVPPPVLFLAAAGAQRLLPAAGRKPLRTVAATALAGSAGVLAAPAVGGFRRAGTTVDPRRPQRSSRLVTTGANAISRNPMYLSLAGGLAAHALWRGGAAPWLPVAAFVTAIDRLQITAEVAALTDAFGADYEAYRQRVRRWL